MKFKVDGREMSAEKMRIREMCEAEQYLNMDMESGFGAKIAVCLFVAMRRDDEHAAKPPRLLADEVLDTDLTALDFEDTEDEADPPAETVTPNRTGDPASLPTSGRQLSVPSA